MHASMAGPTGHTWRWRSWMSVQNLWRLFPPQGSTAMLSEKPLRSKQMQQRLVLKLSLTSHQGVDFDWDLSDKTDTETQTRRGSQAGPADAIVQTDQRIVFQKANGEKRAVRFSSSAERGHRQTTSSSQTRWETRDKEVQVLPRDLDSGQLGPSERCRTPPPQRCWLGVGRRHAPSAIAPACEGGGAAPVQGTPVT